MRPFALSVLAGAMLLALAASPAEATDLKQVEITSATDGPFTVSESASGDLCLSGQTATTFNFVTRSEPNRLDLLVGKRLTCDDGSGTFELVLAVRLTGRDNFTWMVTGGTGKYEDLQGNGTGAGYFSSGVFADHYTGRVGISAWDFFPRRQE